MRVKLDEVPRDVLRRVVRHLESIRGSRMVRGAEAARLGDVACPIHRPDVDGIAYWEIEVAGIKATPAITHRAFAGTGFVIASVGRHDVPIPHWSLDKQPPSRALEEKVGVGKIARIVKADALTYVAEDDKGAHLGHLGQLPLRIGGVPAGASREPRVSTAHAASIHPSKNDKQAGELQLELSGAPVQKAELTAWKSWEEAKTGFAAAYEPHLAALRARAASAWDVEDLILKFGEGIHGGQRLTVPLLKPGKATVAGDGGKAVRLAMLDRHSPAVQLDATEAHGPGEMAFEVQIAYADHTSETLKFFVVPKGTPSNHRTEVPHLTALPRGVDQ